MIKFRRNNGKRPRPTVFLDRDGVINRNRDDYVKSWQEFEFLPGALEALRLLAKHDVRVVVVTNQSAVGRGIISEKTLNAIHRRMLEEVKRQGGKVDGIMCCPHRPEDGCECRKPRPGLFQRAMKLFDFDSNSSCFVGDSYSDLIAARSAGIPFVLVSTGKSLPPNLQDSWVGNGAPMMAADLGSAVRHFIGQRTQQERTA